MDEYLRSRYKRVDGGDSAKPARPASGRYVPPQPERLYHRPAKPMFPVNPKPQPPAHQPEPKIEAKPAPAHPQTVAKHHARPNRRFPFVKVFLGLFLIVAMAAGGGYYYLNYVKAHTPLPKQLVKSASFPIYYPAKLPGAFKYQPGSANNPSSLFTYKVADGSDGVVVTEQAKPTTNFNPSGLPNFKTINVSAGSAVIGISSNVLTIVYVTPSTLINMTGVNGISRSDMISIAQSLTSVK